MRSLRSFFPVFLCALAVAGGAGCDGSTPASGPDAGAGVRARFELVPDPIDFGAVPFPDDLYRAGGGIALGRFPGETEADPQTVASLRASLAEIDGFGVTSAVFFEIEGAIDPSSLPASPSASLVEDASAFLVDADPASPTAFQRIPVVARWDPVAQRVSLQPVDGRPLTPGRRYAAVLTSGVRAEGGGALLPSRAFETVRDASSRPSDPLAAEAYDAYAPVLATLARQGISREQVAALAVFTVQTVGRDFEDARALVYAGSAPRPTIRRVVGAGPALDALLGTPEGDGIGGDAPGGVRHGHIAWVIDGTFPSRELASPAPGVHGAWQRDAGGALVVRRSAEVWFTLVLPQGVDLADVPVVVYQHGLGGQRGDVFAVADALCAAGFAVAAIDIPYHGMRTTGAPDDRRHQYGASEGPDLYGDRVGQVVYTDYLGIGDEAGELVPFHPFYVRDVLRQSVVDLMSLVRVLDEGDFAAVPAMGGPAFAISERPMGFVGVSLGGILGTIFVAHEPRIGAALLSVTGGHLSRLVERSPAFGATFLGILLPRVGLFYEDIDWDAQPASAQPGVVLYQMLLDRGDSIAHAAHLGQRPVHLLMHLARDDETVPNSATEALARAIGMPIVGGAPRFTDLEPAAAPLSWNATVGEMMVTRALYVWEPATHGMLSSRGGESRFEPPLDPPFRRRAAPVLITNPVAQAQEQMRHFFATWLEGIAQIAPAE
jgi:dienelactone hydrolase